MTPLAGLRVVEIGESIAIAVAGMILADHGAEVTLVEPPGGSRLRELPAWRMLTRGVGTVELDLTTSEGRGRMAALAGQVDVVLTGLEPATADRLGVDGATLCSTNPRLVHCEVTGFGRGHPLSGVPGHEGAVTAAAGRAHEMSVLYDGERPAFPAVPVATHGATMLALQGIFAALAERERTGRGQQVQTSLLRALGVFDIGTWAPGASRDLRIADSPAVYYLVARSADGVWLQCSQNSLRLFHGLMAAIGLDHLLAEERFAGAPHVADPGAGLELRARMLARFEEKTWAEWQEAFAGETQVSVEPLAWPGDALDHPQLRHVGDVVEVDGVKELGPLATLEARPAADPPASADPGRRLLEGVTVLELATWIATPMATALLAELGARVIKIEPLDGDPMRAYGPTGMKFSQGKESLAVDLKTPAGREIVHRLVAGADVLSHNFRPGVPERLGIDEATLREINPGLVHHYAASYGSTGPMAYRAAFHVTAGAVCGGVLAQCGGDGPPGPDVDLDIDELALWSRRLSQCNEANPDFNAALGAAAAVSMALFARERTGAGQALETRMMASNAYTLAEHFIDYEGRAPSPLPDADRLGLSARYRLYPARTGWLFVAAPSDRELAALGDALGLDDLVGAADAELAGRLGTAIAARDADELHEELVGKGLACVAVHNGPHAAYVFDAPWASELGFVETSTADGSGPYQRYGRYVQTERDLGPLGSYHPAGAHTRALLAEVGYGPDEVDRLAAAGVIGV